MSIGNESNIVAVLLALMKNQLLKLQIISIFNFSVGLKEKISYTVIILL